LSISCLSRPAAFFVVLVFLTLLLDPCETAAAIQADRTKLSITVFFPENLSGKPAPLKALRESLVRGLASTGISLLDDSSLERFMIRHRIRNTGGLDDISALALKTEENIEAVLIFSVTLYDESSPPKLEVIARLVSTGEKPTILWMDSVALSGDDSPGILGIGLITDPAKLGEKAVGSLVRSLSNHLSGGKAEVKPVKGRYRPSIFYEAEALPPGKRYTVAVAPFFNTSDRKYAGEIMVLHFIEELVRFGGFDVVEPGVVRQKLLNLRVIMNEGISLIDADHISLALKADLVIAGKVIVYQDYAGQDGSPVVDFSALAIENKKVVWASKSYNKGDDGVFFFDRGKVNTAGGLTSYMVRSLVGEISQYEGKAGTGGSGLKFSPGPAD